MGGKRDSAAMMGGALLREKTTVEQMVGVFGALGVFYLVNRQALGRYGAGAIINWLFWLGLNLVFGFTNTGIGIWDHIGGLVAGMIIAALLMPRLRRRPL